MIPEGTSAAQSLRGMTDEAHPAYWSELSAAFVGMCLGPDLRGHRPPYAQAETLHGHLSSDLRHPWTDLRFHLIKVLLMLCFSICCLLAGSGPRGGACLSTGRVWPRIICVPSLRQGISPRIPKCQGINLSIVFALRSPCALGPLRPLLSS